MRTRSEDRTWRRVAWSLGVGACSALWIGVAGLLATPGREAVYSVGAVVAGRLRQPDAWVGRVVAVRGVTVAWNGAYGAWWVLVGTDGAGGGAALSLAPDRPSPWRIWADRAPVLAAMLPAAQQPSGQARVYRLRLLRPTPCAVPGHPVRCADAVVLDAGTGW